MRNVYVYTKIQTFGKKQDSLNYVFIYIKQDTLSNAICNEKLKLAFLYKKHDTLRYVTFLYTKIQTLRKKQDNLRYVFISVGPAEVLAKLQVLGVIKK